MFKFATVCNVNLFDLSCFNMYFLAMPQVEMVQGGCIECCVELLGSGIEEKKKLASMTLLALCRKNASNLVNFYTHHTYICVYQVNAKHFAAFLEVHWLRVPLAIPSPLVLLDLATVSASLALLIGIRAYFSCFRIVLVAASVFARFDC